MGNFCFSPKPSTFLQQLRSMAPPKKKKASKPQLTSVRPSGQREESFFELVYEVARQIPRGRVTSYGAIAACLGTRLSARMVGWAMNRSSLARPKVPAHRVVNRLGRLSGKQHFSPPDQMQALLEQEGISVQEDQVVDFQRLFWDPAKELL
jgi:methylated-DNA-protein-cysteine methyltransferase-like protein